MKIMIASDIHGSFNHTKKLFDAYDSEKADKIILLGDLLYHGPRNALPELYMPSHVVSLLNLHAEDIIAVRGNCDADVDQMMLDFPIMSDYSIVHIDGVTLFATHGHIYNPNHPPKMKGKYVLLNGHTHISGYEEYDQFFYVNPGSVSIPKGNTPHGYVLYENNRFIWKDLDLNEYLTLKI